MAAQASASVAPRTGKYVALGSSFAAGGGTSDPSDVIDLGCGRLSTNYAHRVAVALGMDLTDVTCGGATIDNIVGTPQVTPSDNLTRPPQIDAVTADTSLVTITAGGNDVRLISSLWYYACQADPAVVDNIAGIPGPLKPIIKGALCGGVVDEAAIATAQAGVQQEMIDLIKKVKARAPSARVIIVDYATILPQSGNSCEGVPLTKAQLKYISGIATELQHATKAAAKAAGAELVELSKASARHDACSGDPWVSAWEFGPVLSGGTSAFHPTSEGMQAAADLVVRQFLKGRQSHP